MEYIDVLDIKDLKEGSNLVTVNNQSVVIFKWKENLSAIGNKCLHKGGPLSEGAIKEKYDGCYVTCPWHGWEYNIKTGSAPPGYKDQQARYDLRVDNNRVLVSNVPITKAKLAKHKSDPLADLRTLKYKTNKNSLNILGISTTNQNKNLPRESTSENALNQALLHAKKEHKAKTFMLRLRDLNFRNCEGYYSRHENACTWPCSISEMDKNDGMNEVYRKLILWADIVILATPIRWGNASALYYQMVERLNCVQNQITLKDRTLIKNKVASFIITGGQDNIQHVAGEMMNFFSELGFAIPPFGYMGWSRGWLAEDMEHNIEKFKKSRYIHRTVKELIDNSIKLSKQIKANPNIKLDVPFPKRTDA